MAFYKQNFPSENIFIKKIYFEVEYEKIMWNVVHYQTFIIIDCNTSTPSVCSVNDNNHILSMNIISSTFHLEAIAH